MKIFLILFLFCTLINAQTNYTDSFNSAPFSGNPTSFTTGSSTVGLSYVAGANSDFGYDGTNFRVNVIAPYGDPGSFTITARDGKAFYFNSIYIYLPTGDIAINGSGFETFTININNGATGTYSPSGGAKLVTQVVIASVAPHDFLVDFDDVSTQVGYSILTFTDGSVYGPSITPGNTNQAFGRFKLTSDYSGSSLSSAVIKLNGVRTGASNFKLWSSANDSFGGDTQIGSTIAADPGDGNSITFSSFSSVISSSGSYFFVTCDLASDATGSLQGTIVQNSNLSFSAGALSGTITNAALSNDSSPLPVELISFTASILEEGVKLNWQTATEVDNYGFEIERTLSGVEEWELLGFVEGFGNSNSPKEYSFTDDLTHNLNRNLRYRLKQIDTYGAYEFSDVIEISLVPPSGFELKQNYPNPFNPSTAIKFSLPVNSNVTIMIYDMLGREVTKLIDEEKPAGSYILYWYGKDNNGRLAASGIYFYKLETDKYYSFIRKMVLLK